jgi:MFS family permease
LLIDKLGRRYSTLIGFYIQAFAFLTLAFSIDEFTLGVIFPILIGIGFTLSVWGAVIHIFELAPKGYLNLQQGVVFVVFGIGAVAGVITDTLLEGLILSNPMYLPMVLIFAFLTATIAVLQVPETLPSSDELEWRNKVEHLLVLSIGGLPIYSERLSKTPAPSMGPDEMLVGGALSGISELVREISRSAADLKVIQQEGYCILLEDGGTFIVAVMAFEELEAIRTRMQDFRDDFKRIYGSLVEEWAGNPSVFSPVKELVERHFA